MTHGYVRSANKSKRRQLNRETETRRIATAFPNQPQVLVIQDEELIKLSNSRRASEHAIRRDLLVGQKVNIHRQIGHTGSNHGSQ